MGAYGDWHERGLEVLGLNFDFIAGAREASESAQGVQWPSVDAIGSPDELEIWSDASRVSGVPMYFVRGRDAQLMSFGPRLDWAALEAELAP